jgi:hypothetical protein
MLRKAPLGCLELVISLHRTPKYEAMLPQIVEMANARSGIDLISRALGIGAEFATAAAASWRLAKS